MPSQLELAMRSPARLEEKFPGQDSPYMKELKAQIAMYKRSQHRRETGGFWDENGRVKPNELDAQQHVSPS